MFSFPLVISGRAALNRTWSESLVQPLSAHQYREGISTTVGLVDFSDLHCVVHQVKLDGDWPGFPVIIVPQGKEPQDLQVGEVIATSQCVSGVCYSVWILSYRIYLAVHSEKQMHWVILSGFGVARLRYLTTFDVRILRYGLRIVQNNALTLHESLF